MEIQQRCKVLECLATLGEEKKGLLKFEELGYKYKKYQRKLPKALELISHFTELDDFSPKKLTELLEEENFYNELLSKFKKQNKVPSKKLEGGDEKLYEELLEKLRKFHILIGSKATSSADYKVWREGQPQLEPYSYHYFTTLIDIERHEACPKIPLVSLLRARQRHVKLIRDPEAKFGFSEDEDMFNTIPKPLWYQQELERNSVKDFAEFMKYLLPNVKERRRVYDYMYMCMEGRSNFHLVLAGKKGIGKGTFFTIMSGLLQTGLDQDTQIARRSSRRTGDSGFNGEYIGARFMYFNERVVKGEFREELKELIDKTKGVEKKGKDVQQEPVTFSCFISNNLRDAKGNQNYFLTDDRIFFVPQLTELPFDRQFFQGVKASQWRQNLEEKIKDINYVYNIRRYIIKNKTADSYKELLNKRPEVTSYMYNLILDNLSPWQIYVKDYPRFAENFDADENIELPKRAYPLYEIIDNFKIWSSNADNKIPTERRIVQFIKDFSIRGQKIGEVIEVPREKSQPLTIIKYNSEIKV